MKRAGFCFFALLLLATAAHAADDSEVFRQVLARASRISTLALPGAAPFHLKLSAQETYHHLPEYSAKIEVWWTSPEKWRREVPAAAFTQTAVRDGQRYFESNSADYLPFWLHELLQESVDPIPQDELLQEQVELTKQGCAEWQAPYEKEKETVSVHHSVCFNADGTLRQLFTPTMSVLLGNYGEFAGKKIAHSITAWPRGGAEIRATVDSLEPLLSEDSLFVLSGSTPYPARLRFVSVPEASLQLDTQVSAPLTWPVVHNFPASGVMAVNVKLDREGAVREVGTILSSNFVLTGVAREQILKWKFKPYLVEGVPVQVNTTLAIHFDAKMELLGASGHALPVEPFLQRMKKSRELSDPRTTDSSPFHLHATFQDGAGQPGSYDEIWVSQEKWRREIQFGPTTLQQARNGEQLFHKLSGAGDAPPEMNYVLELLVAGHFPDRHYDVYEADWGQSAVTFAGTDTVRVARGQVDSNNQPISGQAYWFNPSGLLLGDYEQTATTTYSEFLPWNSKQVARRVEVTANGIRGWLIVIDKLESLFVLDGVQPEDASKR
jgi:hypothetical protein